MIEETQTNELLTVVIVISIIASFVAFWLGYGIGVIATKCSVKKHPYPYLNKQDRADLHMSKINTTVY